MEVKASSKPSHNFILSALVEDKLAVAEQVEVVVVVVLTVVYGVKAIFNNGGESISEDHATLKMWIRFGIWNSWKGK